MYRWVYLPKRENSRPEQVVYRSDTTSYKTQFPKHDVEPRKDDTHKDVCVPPDEPFDGKTHYNSMYRWVYLPKRDNSIPEEVVNTSDMPFDDTTSYNTNKATQKKGHLRSILRQHSSAGAHDINQKSKDYTPKEVYVPPDEPFEGQSHNSMYRWVYLPKRENSRPEQVVYRSDTTSYKTQFPKHDVEPRKDDTPKDVCVPPDEPFDGKTHYNSMYRWVYLPKRDNSIPEEVVNTSDMPFDDTTSYNTNKATQKKGHLRSILRQHSSAGAHDINQKSKDYTPKEVYVPPDEPFEGQSHNSMYRWVYLPKRENYRPEQVVYRSDTTSYKTQFPKHDVEPRKDDTPKDVCVPPDEPFEGKTHYNSMYRWVYLPKRENSIPEEVVNTSDMASYNTSKATQKKGHLRSILRHHSSAGAHDINQKSKDYTPKEVYVPPDESFEGQTHNSSMYRWVYLPKRENSRPEQVVYRSDTTSYKTQFPKHDVEPRKDDTPKDVCVPSDEPFEGKTHYNSMYRWVYLPNRDDSIPEEVVNTSDMASYNTSKATQKKGHLPSILRHHSSAGTHDINQQSKDCTPKDVYVTPDEPFEGLTVDTRKNVTLKYQENSENFKPAEVVFLCEEPFDVTSDKAQFPKRNPKPRKGYSPKEVACRSKIPYDDTTSEKTKLPKLDAKPHKDYSLKQVSVPPDVPLGDLTDYRKTFKGRYLPKRDSLKPKQIAYKPQMMDSSRVSKLH